MDMHKGTHSTDTGNIITESSNLFLGENLILYTATRICLQLSFTMDTYNKNGPHNPPTFSFKHLVILYLGFTKPDSLLTTPFGGHRAGFIRGTSQS